MKSFNLLRGAAVAVILAFITTACGGGGAAGGSASLVGKWQVSDIKINGKSMEEAVNERLEKDGNTDEASKELAKGMIKGMMEGFMKTTAEFTEDGKCTLSLAGQTSNFSYKLSEDGKTVSFEGDGASGMAVTNLSSDSFTLEQNSSPDEKIQMMFKRQ